MKERKKERNIHAVLRETAVRMLNTDPMVSEPAVVAAARASHPEKFDAEVERFIQNSAEAIVRRIFGSLTADDDDAQLRFPGFELPTALCLKQLDGPALWVMTSKATWNQLMAGRQLRAENVERAQHRLDQYDEALRRLRPHMEGHPAVSVADAIAAIEADDDDA